MKKLLSALVAVLFTAVSASAFAAAHGGAPMKDGDKMEKKEAKKTSAKKAPKKSSAKKGEAKKGAPKKSEDKK